MYQSYKIIKVSTIRDSNYGYVDPFGICVALHIFTERSQLSPDRNVKKLNEILRKK